MKNIGGLFPVVVIVFSVLSCSTSPKVPQIEIPEDKFPWLEEIDGEAAMNWVKEHNDKSLTELKADSRYASIVEKTGKIILAEDRLAQPAMRNGWVYNFWQDAKSVHGLWRRTKLADYQKSQPRWESVLDLDILSKEESENWVWKGTVCLPPASQRCLLKLSRGGKDAIVVREFDTVTKKFITDGFSLPEAHTSAVWMNLNTLLVGTDWGSDSLTPTGYPRIIKIWKRGTSASDATTVYEGAETDVMVSPSTYFRPEGRTSVITRSMNFYSHQYRFVKLDGSMQQLPIPEDSILEDIFQGQIIFRLRTDWKSQGTIFTTGSLLSLQVLNMNNEVPVVIYKPDARASITEVLANDKSLYVNVLKNVQGEVYRFNKIPAGWQSQKAVLPEQGTIHLTDSDPFHNPIFIEFESFLKPVTLFLAVDSPTSSLSVVRSLPERFDSRPFSVEQYEVASRDGIKIPYFVIAKKDLLKSGANPTLLYGYGGFEASMTPFYLGAYGKVWSEQGGVYVLANIRGGGEFGPAWHQAALKANRQKAFDDFIAVAQDLIKRKITSPPHLGIMGGSNGGLLVAAVMVQRPELFNAVVCQVPLIDMMRYHHLLAGNFWVAEYGDPDDPEMAKILLKYSPYQNVRQGLRYPRPFIITSTKDDRVHPGHARKMAAKLEAAGHAVLYFENTDGGHGASANLNEVIQRMSLEMTYLSRQLMGP